MQSYNNSQSLQELFKASGNKNISFLDYLFLSTFVRAATVLDVFCRILGEKVKQSYQEKIAEELIQENESKVV